MLRPANKYAIAEQERAKLPGLYYHNPSVEAFEEGVDAGRKWGHEEKDKEWREAIHRALRNHTEQFVYGHERIIPVEHIEALL